MVPHSEITLHISADRLELDLHKKAISPDDQSLLCMHALLRQGNNVYDTEELDLPASGFLPCDGSKACASQRRMLRGSLSRALLLARLFSQQSPDEALASLPPYCAMRLSIPCDHSSKGRVIETLLKSAVQNPRAGCPRATATPARGSPRTPHCP